MLTKNARGMLRESEKVSDFGGGDSSHNKETATWNEEIHASCEANTFGFVCSRISSSHTRSMTPASEGLPSSVDAR